MATYTPNYRLHQWVPEDKFLRTDFNEDFSKIDTALKAAEGEIAAAEARSTERLAVVGHDVYNLMLQSHYDGKVTGWKKALVFDGFQDKSLVAEASDSLVFTGEVVGLCSTSQDNISMGYSGSAAFTQSRRTAGPFTSQGYAMLTGICIKTQCLSTTPEEKAAIVHYKVFINDNEILYNSAEIEFRYEPAEQTLTFSSPCLIAPGDEFYVEVYFNAGNRLTFQSNGAPGDLGGTIFRTAISGETGSLTTPALALPERSQLRAWVRFTSDGTVSLSAVGTDEIPFPFDVLGDRAAINTAGEACIEREFVLHTPPETGNLSFQLDLTLTGDHMRVFDYGILLL